MPGRARVGDKLLFDPSRDLIPYADFTEAQKLKVSRARDNGIVNPVWAIQVALWAKMPPAVLCAYLEQETAGGHNLWGHDKTWMIGYPVLNEDTYSVYKAHRSAFGNQGVGPMQLTHPTFQDRADAMGGCWQPLTNMLCAADWLRDQKDRGLDWHAVARAYNGSDAYANHNDELRAKWKDILL